MLFTIALRRGGIGRLWALTDVVVAAAGGLVVGGVVVAEEVTTWSNWSLGPLIGGSIVAATYLTLRLATPAILGLGCVYALALVRAWPEESVLSSGIGNVMSIIGFGFLARFAVTWMRRGAREMERLAAELADARGREAEERARTAERRRQYWTLHDTVLSTLTQIATGAFGEVPDDLKRRCAGEAAYLRSLIEVDAGEIRALHDRLGQLARDFGPAGILVSVKVDGIPHDLPDEVTEALSLASREALNNVQKHAQTDRAWVTATGDDDGGVVVTIVDRGIGFDPEGPRSDRGLGLTGSICARLEEVGGVAVVDSRPGEGTSVELKWPR